MESHEIFMKAKGLGKHDFKSALEGLMAGHQEALNELKAKLAEKDMAFLMALALTEKGKRLDKDGIMEKAIVDGLNGLATCETERKFLERALTPDPK